jgi:hypothetical protein
MQFVDPMSFEEALEKLGSQSVAGSTLTSAEWADIPVGLRDNAFFSATIEDVRCCSPPKILLTISSPTASQHWTTANLFWMPAAASSL